MDVNKMSKAELLEYARLSQLRKSRRIDFKLSQIEKDRYVKVAEDKGVTESELYRQALHLSLYRFVGVKQEKE